MAGHDTQQVFFDPTRRRWRLVVAAAIVIVLVLSVPLTTLAVRILHAPALPTAALTLPGGSSARPVDPAGNEAEGIPPQPVTLASDRARETEQALASLPLLKPGAIADRHWGTLAYLATDDDPSTDSVLTQMNVIDVVMPDWYYLADATGGLAEYPAPGRSVGLETLFKARADARIIPVINDDIDEIARPDVVAAMLANRESRFHFIDNVVAFATRNRLAGVNISFGGLDAKVMPRFEQFIGELQRSFHPLGMSLLVTVDLDDPTYRVDRLAALADLVVINTFDRAIPPRPEALAPQRQFADALTKRVADADPSRIAVAIANYGFDWNDKTREIKRLGPQAALRLAETHDATVRLDPTSLNPTFSYRGTTTGNAHTVWYMDAVTSFNQIQTIRSLGIGSIAIGRLGGEDAAVWPLLATKGALTEADAAHLGALSFRHHVDYLGQGDVLRVGGDFADGARSVIFDGTSGLIVGETIHSYPSVPTATLSGKPQPGEIVLTFDDGPDPRFTGKILDILRDFDVKATFFVIGRNALQEPALTARIVAEGHDIANHTYNHPNIALISLARLKMELSATQRVIESTTGRDTVLFRPPFGEEMTPTSPDHMGPLAAATAEGYYSVAYTIDPRDWRSNDAALIAQRVIDGARADKSGIVLFHDGGGNREATVEALPSILATLKAEGFTFPTVSEILDLPGAGAMPEVATGFSIEAAMQAGGLAILRVITPLLTALFFAAIALSLLRVALIVVLALRNRRKDAQNAGYLPSVAVIVPAYNEEKVIAKTIRSLLASTYPNLEIIVVDDGSKDATAQVARDRFAGEPRVRVVTKPNGGKARALNHGIAMTDAEIIVGLDADTIFRSDTIWELTRPFADARVGAVAGNAKVGNRINLMTRWQALEYIVSQNLDRRAFELINAIAVVPGAVGAWRRSAVEAAGGFTPDTLAEDADLTIRVNRAGYTVRNRTSAVAMTEAPDTVRGFISQRSRWTLGTLQVAWKNRDALFRRRSGAVGWVIVPQTLLFQFAMPLVAPFADLFAVLAIGDALMAKYYHPTQAWPDGLGLILLSYAVFLFVDIVIGLVAYANEPREDRRLLLWLPIQRFFYRQLLYYVAIKSVIRAIAGVPQGWNTVTRKATVAAGLSMPHAGRS